MASSRLTSAITEFVNEERKAISESTVNTGTGDWLHTQQPECHRPVKEAVSENERRSSIAPLQVDDLKLGPSSKPHVGVQFPENPSWSWGLSSYA